VFYLARWVQGQDWTAPGSPLTMDYPAGFDSSANPNAGASAYDLRPPGQLDGWAIMWTSEVLPASQRLVALSDDPADRSQTIAARIASALGRNVDAQPTLRRLLLSLVMHGDFADPTLWNPLRPSRGRYELRLGPLYDSILAVSGGALSDPFTRADSTNISTGAPFTWTELAGDLEISSNQLRVVTGASANTVHVARADSDLGGADHYAAVDAVTMPNTSDRIGPRVRANSTAADQSGYVMYGRRNATSTYVLVRLNNAGSLTAITTISTTAMTVTSVLRLEVSGSSFTGYDDGVSVITGTDSTLVGTRLRSGVYLLNAALNGQPVADNFAADILQTAVAVSDTASVATDEATTAITVTLARTDTADVSLTEASANTSTLARTDTTDLSVTEASTNASTLARADTADVAVAEGTTALDVALARADVLDVAADEVAAVVVAFDAADALDAAVGDTAALVVAVAVVDTADLSVADVAAALSVLIDAADLLDLSAGEATALGATVAAADALDLATVDVAALTAMLTASDTAGVALSNASALVVFVLAVISEPTRIELADRGATRIVLANNGATRVEVD
jgi:hypothetical protein